MAKVTGKLVLRALRPTQVMEASEQAILRKQINDAIRELTKSLSAAEKVRKTAVADLKGIHADCNRAQDDIARTVEFLMDSGRSGVDARVDALENVSGDFEDLLDNIEVASSFLGTQIKTRTGGLGSRGAKDATVPELRSDLSQAKRDVKDVAKDLRAAVKAIKQAADRLDVTADIDDEKLYAEFQDVVADDINDAEYTAEELEDAAERLEG